MLTQTLANWLRTNADGLDDGSVDAAEVLPQLAAADLLRIGVPDFEGVQSGNIGDAVLAIAAVARESLTAAFTLWGQRTFIEYLLQSPNHALRERLLPDLLTGRLAGATGLSNAMKHLSGLEKLQVNAQPIASGWRLQGQLPWITNLRPSAFVSAIAVTDSGDNSARIFALPSDAPGLTRSSDLNLIGLRASNTAALTLDGVELGSDWLIHDDARRFLPTVRPAFLGLQCGMSLGLAEQALQHAATQIGEHRQVLSDPLQHLRTELAQLQSTLLRGLQSQVFLLQPEALFKLRIALSELTQAAVQLELQASGGKAYLLPQNGFARRLRESAFVPVVTPSVVQLRTELARQQTAQEAA